LGTCPEGPGRLKLCEAEGDLAEAEAGYRDLAESGHRAGAGALGVLVATLDAEEWDDLETPEIGEAWWDIAVHGHDAASARELGVLLTWDPGVIKREHRLRTAYEAGDLMAGYQLGALLRERHWRYSRRGWKHAADRLFDAVLMQTYQAGESLSACLRS
jgi:hypothetical protein